MLGNRTRVVMLSALPPVSSWQRTTASTTTRVSTSWWSRCSFSTTKDPSSTTATVTSTANASTSSTSTSSSRPKGDKEHDVLPRQDSARKVVRRKPKEPSSTNSNSNSNYHNNPKLSERKRDWKQQELGAPKAFPVIQPSMYYYTTTPSQERRASMSKAASPRLVLPVMNASALLDPLKYCKKSSRLSFNRTGVNRSISGTDAARRLLRGKKDFILAARSLKAQPTLLEGHGVPPQLFQHCIDMADSLLLQYSPDVVECAFHNYNYVQGQTKLPTILRIRGRDATNRCSPWPPDDTPVQDWDYHLELYLTVMERMAGHLGMVLQKKQLPPLPPPPVNHTTDMLLVPSDEDDDGDELTSSPFLFPNSNMPQWNVDILRGSYFDLHKDGPLGTVSKDIAPMPIVEFSKESEHTGHVIIRLQGRSSDTNLDFQTQRSKQPVTLVFDACFRSERN